MAVGSCVQKPGPVLVLDLETGPDPAVLALVPKAPREIARWVTHQIHAASILAADLTETGEWQNFRLRSWLAADVGEEHILERLNSFCGPACIRGTIVTYNGRRHDFEVLRRRVARYLRMDLSTLICLRDLGMDMHADMFTIVAGAGCSRPPSLRDVCAGLDITTDSTAVSKHGTSLHHLIRKGQVDVVATFLLYLYEAGLSSSSAMFTLKGWDALAAYLKQRSRQWPHLMQFWRHPIVSECPQPEFAGEIEMPALGF